MNLGKGHRHSAHHSKFIHKSLEAENVPRALRQMYKQNGMDRAQHQGMREGHSQDHPMEEEPLGDTLILSLWWSCGVVEEAAWGLGPGAAVGWTLKGRWEGIWRVLGPSCIMLVRLLTQLVYKTHTATPQKSVMLNVKYTIHFKRHHVILE